jgi:arylsulfatase A-like enzyme
MKAIMIMFDSLNRRYLPPYGCEWVHAPNFERLAGRTVIFDNCYVASMPCMPARRELHTGRYNFLHRSWGPVEPFDDSMPEILKQHGVYTHLVTDHLHYWEDGGATYHSRYSSYEFVRGQEGDAWKAVVNPGEFPEAAGRQNDAMWRQDQVNRRFMASEADQPQSQTFQLGLEFIRRNAQADNWFLQIETFDPHEPFFSQERYKALYPHEYSGPLFDWPSYGRVSEPPEMVEHMRREYAALLSMCDHSLGRVLDLMDELDLWQDTLLIVNTDHGFLLGEHEWWAKVVQPFYSEVARTPLFLWDPRSGKRAERRSGLVQMIDLAPSLLEFFGAPIPADMRGIPLREATASTEAADSTEAAASNAPTRPAVLFGAFGGQINVTDGRYVYMRGAANPDNGPLYEYTLLPTHMRNMFAVDELQEIELAGPLPFTKGCRVMKIPATRQRMMHPHVFTTLLFDLQTDPLQEHPLQDAQVEASMVEHLLRLMQENDAPAEQYERVGLA